MRDSPTPSVGPSPIGSLSVLALRGSLLGFLLSILQPPSPISIDLISSLPSLLALSVLLSIHICPASINWRKPEDKDLSIQSIGQRSKEGEEPTRQNSVAAKSSTLLSPQYLPSHITLFSWHLASFPVLPQEAWKEKKRRGHSINFGRSAESPSLQLSSLHLSLYLFFFFILYLFFYIISFFLYYISSFFDYNKKEVELFHSSL